MPAENLLALLDSILIEIEIERERDGGGGPLPANPPVATGDWVRILRGKGITLIRPRFLLYILDFLSSRFYFSLIEFGFEYNLMDVWWFASVDVNLLIECYFISVRIDHASYTFTFWVFSDVKFEFLEKFGVFDV